MRAEEIVFKRFQLGGLFLKFQSGGGGGRSGIMPATKMMRAEGAALVSRFNAY